MRYMEKTLRQTAQALREGGVFIDPVRSAGPDGVDACRFCDMRAVCRFEGQPRELAPWAPPVLGAGDAGRGRRGA